MRSSETLLSRGIEPDTSTRIPSLDGFRAIAIAMVLVCHESVVLPVVMPPQLRAQFVRLGPSGVRIFFVLSGFLITSILLRELEKTGKISLWRFYIRRALRIFPAYVAFLIGLAFLCSTGILSIPKPRWEDYLPAALYVSDYLSVPWPLSHTWSLSVEEQFYFVWPAALLFFSLRNNKALIPIGVICVAPLFRFAALFGMTIFGDQQFETVADALAVGCLLAIYKDKVGALLTRMIPTGLSPFVLPAAGLAIVLLDGTANHPRILAPLGLSLMNVVIGIAIIFAVERPPKWLNYRAIVGLGRVSYSLYLWQQPLFQDYRLRYWWVVISLVCAYFSFRLIERPILSWRDAWTPELKAP